MPDKPSFLTDPQWRILTYAVTTRPTDHPEWGKLSSYYTQHRSLENLLKHQMIVEGYDVRTISERHALGKRLEDSVTDARHFLELGDWQQALQALKMAESHSHALARKAYWITDEAKTYLFPS